MQSSEVLMGARILNDEEVTASARRLLHRADDILTGPAGLEVWHTMEQLVSEVERMRAALARALRLIAVERGDESQAPEGWSRVDGDCWCRHDDGFRTDDYGNRGSMAVIDGDWSGPLSEWHGEWDGEKLPAQPSALEAMEAVDAARARSGMAHEPEPATAPAPCPWCGDASVGIWRGRHMCAMACSSCGANGPTCTYLSDALEAWNRRA